MKWQEKVQNEDRVLMRGCRRSGKTYGALKWAGQAGNRVLMVIPFNSAMTHIKYTAQAIFQDEVIRIERANGVGICIELTEDRKIWVLAQNALSTARGVRVDAVVVEDAEVLDEEYSYQILARMFSGTPKFFVSYTCAASEQERKNIAVWERLEPHHVTIDYLDLLEAGVLYASHIRELHGIMSPTAFANEMGPYERPRFSEYTNEDFRFLLSEVK